MISNSQKSLKKGCKDRVHQLKPCGGFELRSKERARVVIGYSRRMFWLTVIVTVAHSGSGDQRDRCHKALVLQIGTRCDATRSSAAIGPDLFRAACNMGLEGLVSKRRDRPYRGGRSKDWVKVKNRQHPAMERVIDVFG